jgi:nitrogen-specific signal transduction histidine kinase
MMTDQYLQIIESVPLGIVVIDPFGHIQTMNGYARNILDAIDTPVNDKHRPTLPDLFIPSDLFLTDHFRKTDGVKIRFHDKILEITASRVKGEKKESPNTVITLRDITEIEKIKTVEKNNAKFAFINELSADIAHEIRNPLGSIELLASLLKKESNRAKDIKRANQIMAAVKTVENAISGLILRNKRDQLPLTHVNIHDLLKEITLFSETINDGGGVFLSVKYADVEPIIECNADMVKQVFLYLILSVLTGTGSLDILTRHLEEHRIIEIHFIEKDKYASPKRGSCIRGLLSSLKKDRWGIGLAIVHRMVNLYQGWLSIECRDEASAELILFFPLLPGTLSMRAGTDDPNGITNGNDEEK